MIAYIKKQTIGEVLYLEPESKSDTESLSRIAEGEGPIVAIPMNVVLSALENVRE